MGTLIPRHPDPEDFRIFTRWVIDPDEGKVYNLKGDEIGSIRKGADRVFIGTYRKNKPRFFKRYHLVWWFVTGAWPTSLIDHKDRVPTHDWFDNLELSNSYHNGANVDRQRGLPTGVVKHQQADRYVAQICIGNKTKYLGIFKTPEEAHAARLEAERSLGLK